MKPPVAFWLRALLTAMLIMVINIVLSVLEVFIYSLFMPGKPRAFYDAHALVSAPWVAGIAGGLLMFIFVRRYISKNTVYQIAYAIALPTAYTVIDVAILIAIHTNFSDGYGVLLLAAMAKYLGAAIAIMVNPKKIFH